MIPAHKRVISALLILSCIASGACTRSRSAAGEIRLASVRSGICTIHHVALRRVVMYDFSESVPSDPSLTTYKLERQFPNADLRLARTKSESRYMRKPVKVTVCPVCQRLSDKYIASHPNAP